MRLLVAAAAALVLAAAVPASARPLYEPGGECNGVVDHGCYVTDPVEGPYSCTVWTSGICILKHAP